MVTAGSRLLVHAAYTAQYADPIAFRVGETVEVGHADAEFPEWFWCRGPDAKEGWVHCSFLSATTGRVTGAQDYSAKELTVEAGTTGRVIHLLGGWAYLHLDDDRCGWVPAKVIRCSPAAAEFNR